MRQGAKKTTLTESTGLSDHYKLGNKQKKLLFCILVIQFIFQVDSEETESVTKPFMSDINMELHKTTPKTATTLANLIGNVSTFLFVLLHASVSQTSILKNLQAHNQEDY